MIRLMTLAWCASSNSSKPSNGIKIRQIYDASRPPSRSAWRSAEILTGKTRKPRNTPAVMVAMRQGWGVVRIILEILEQRITKRRSGMTIQVCNIHIAFDNIKTSVYCRSETCNLVWEWRHTKNVKANNYRDCEPLYEDQWRISITVAGWEGER